MPFALITAGLIMIVVSAKGTHLAFGAQLRSDFTGDKNFLYWLGAIGGVGAAGYINPFREFSHMFMALIIISMVIHNGGFFDQLRDAIAKGPLPAKTNGNPASSPFAPTNMTAPGTSDGGILSGNPTWMNFLFGPRKGT